MLGIPVQARQRGRIPVRFRHDEPQPALASKWTITKVERALDALEQGDFLEAAMLAEAMGRDDRIAAVWSTRSQGLLSLPFEMQPSEEGDQRKAKAVAKTIGQQWFDAFPEDVEAEALFWEVFIGFGVGQIVVDTERDWLHQLEIWSPQYLRWDSHEQRLIALTTNGPVPVTPGDGQWVVFGGRAKRPWMHGAIRSLSVPWLVRQFSWRDWARYNERHGQPILKAKFPASAGGVSVGGDNDNEWYAKIQNLGRNSVAYLPQGVGEKGEGFDLELLESKARSEDAFDKLISRADTAIAVRMLGQNLSTEVQGGSYAAAVAHNRVRQDYLKADAERHRTDLRSGFTAPWAQRIAGAADLAPWPHRNAEPPEDQKERAAAGEGLGKALKSFNDAGFDVDNAEELAEQYGFEITKREAPEPAPKPPPPAGDEADDELEEGDEQAQAAKAQARVGQRLLAAEDDPGQEYADRIADKMQRHGTRELASTVASMIAAVSKAESYEEARAEIEKRYGKLKPPAELAELTEAALLMSQLGGHTEVGDAAE